MPKQFKLIFNEPTTPPMGGTEIKRIEVLPIFKALTHDEIVEIASITEPKTYRKMRQFIGWVIKRQALRSP